MLKRYRLIVFACAASLAACTNEGAVAEGQTSTAIYADYKIRGEEGQSTVTVVLQFRLGGRDGEAIVLEKPGGVTIDGMALNADSAGISGAYYEAAFPLDTFNGDHLIEFTGPGGEKHKQAFNYAPFAFAKEPPPAFPMHPVTFHLSGLPDSTGLRMILTDTAFATQDINTEIKVVKGALTITDQMWRKLKPGPVLLEIYKEVETPLPLFSKAGGVMTIHYGLKREFSVLPPPKGKSM